MNVEEFGFREEHKDFLKENNLAEFLPGRVLAEHKERYVVITDQGELDAEITGNMRYAASSREDYPVVGDWVLLHVYEESFSIIHRILPRLSLIARRATGKPDEIQPIAANVDVALIMQAVDRDFSLNRLERYLAICLASSVSPVIILTKTDLVKAETSHDLAESIRQRIPGVPVFSLSNITGEGIEQIGLILKKEMTYCMLGSSGVGKSSLMNSLSGKFMMKTDHISDSTGRGRHITSHRELILLDNGALLIDNPGMREVGIAETGEGLELTFAVIAKLSSSCRYTDCTHTVEQGCAVIHAVNDGSLDRSAYENYLRLEREKAHFEASQEERRRKDKAFGKMMKNYKKDIKRNS